MLCTLLPCNLRRSRDDERRSGRSRTWHLQQADDTLVEQAGRDAVVVAVVAVVVAAATEAEATALVEDAAALSGLVVAA